MDAPKDLEIASATETTINVRWIKPVAKIDHYRLLYTLVGGRESEIQVLRDADSYVLTGLEPGKEYSISLTAEKGRHKSKPATVVGRTGK